MTKHEEADVLVRRMLECFNSRQFDQADGLYAPGFRTHPFGGGWEEGKDAWRRVVGQFPDMRVVADDVLVDGDKVTVCSSVHGIGTPDGDAAPVLIEIFRVEAGQLAEWWGSTWLPEID